VGSACQWIFVSGPLLDGRYVEFCGAGSLWVQPVDGFSCLVLSLTGVTLSFGGLGRCGFIHKRLRRCSCCNDYLFGIVASEFHVCLSVVLFLLLRTVFRRS
jgi:hypothetical protein